MSCPFRSSPPLGDFSLQDPTWVTHVFWPHICFVTSTRWPVALGFHVHSEHPFTLGNFHVCRFVLGTTKRTTKNFISLRILGKYVRKTLGKSLLPNFSFLTWGNWKPVSLGSFPLSFWSHSGRVATSNQGVQLCTRRQEWASCHNGCHLPYVSDVFFTHRFFRNQPQNSSTSWLLSPSAWLAPWPSSSRQQRPWKVGWILTCHPVR